MIVGTAIEIVRHPDGIRAGIFFRIDCNYYAPTPGLGQPVQPPDGVERLLAIVESHFVGLEGVEFSEELDFTGGAHYRFRARCQGWAGHGWTSIESGSIVLANIEYQAEKQARSLRERRESGR